MPVPMQCAPVEHADEMEYDVPVRRARPTNTVVVGRQNCENYGEYMRLQGHAVPDPHPKFTQAVYALSESLGLGVTDVDVDFDAAAATATAAFPSVDETGDSSAASAQALVPASSNNTNASNSSAPSPGAASAIDCADAGVDALFADNYYWTKMSCGAKLRFIGAHLRHVEQLIRSIQNRKLYTSLRIMGSLSKFLKKAVDAYHSSPQSVSGNSAASQPSTSALETDQLLKRIDWALENKYPEREVQGAFTSIKVPGGFVLQSAAVRVLEHELVVQDAATGNLGNATPAANTTADANDDSNATAAKADSSSRKKKNKVSRCKLTSR